MPSQFSIAIVGAGPAGLIAAEQLARKGHAVTVFDRMPSPARKFLFAGRGGLNLTHSEPMPAFLSRYGNAHPLLQAALHAFPPAALQAWALDLGEDTFIGTSGRVFPKSFKATPLLRSWLGRLEHLGVRFRPRHDWLGWNEAGSLAFAMPGGMRAEAPNATLLALGGASWPRLGTDGGWVPLLAKRGIAVAPLTASNCGIRVGWSDPFRQRNRGLPLKGMRFSIGAHATRAEAVITATGLEGGAIYALSAPLRQALVQGQATLTIDLKPDVPIKDVVGRLSTARPDESLSNVLRKKLGLSPAAIGLLREAHGLALPRAPVELAHLIKAVPLPVAGLDGLERAISTAGGIQLDEVDHGLMLKKLPGVFVAGEMLDWDAPTGGYLLTACFATGAAAATGILRWLGGSGSSAEA